MIDSILIRTTARRILTCLLLVWPVGFAHAQSPTPTFRAGPWQGSAISNNGSFAFCAMTTSYAIAGVSIGLTIAIDRADDWAVSVYGDQLGLPMQHIDGKVSFDSELPIDVHADVRNPRTLSFLIHGPELLDGHANSKKLTVAFGDKSYHFDLVEFPAAEKNLRDCRETNTRLAAAPPAPSSPVTVAAVPDSPPAKQAVAHAALGTDKVEIHAGPAPTEPVQWVLIRKGLPIEVVDTSGSWKKIRDFEGTEGWVDQSKLSGERTALVMGATRALRSDPKPDAPIVARLEPGVIAQLANCDGAWCELDARGYRGWLEQAVLWGVGTGEIVQQSLGLKPSSSPAATPMDISERLMAGLVRMGDVSQPLPIVCLTLIILAIAAGCLAYEIGRLRRKMREQAKWLAFYRMARTEVVSKTVLSPAVMPATEIPVSRL